MAGADIGQGALSGKVLNATVVVTALGYFIDMYDFFLFNVVRVQSLTDLGLSGDAVTEWGVSILLMQMLGLLLGAVTWGILSDKYGRKSCLFASILVYSLATLACGFVSSVEIYKWLRFVAGFALAGEIGVGITLITEHMNARKRGMGVALFAAMGFLGILAASVASEFMDWRHTYFAGAAGGFLLLVARSCLMESGMFEALKSKTSNLGDLKIIFRNRTLLKRYICSILVGAPIAYCVLLYTFAPEIGADMGIADPVKVSISAGIFQVFLIMGDMGGALLSDRWKSRKRTIAFMQAGAFIVLLAFLFLPKTSAFSYYAFISAFGLTLGYWVLVNTIAAEQFGTNIRATAATTIPNFVRILVVPYTLIFKELRHTDIVYAVGVIGVSVFILSILALRGIEETYNKDLNYTD